MPISLAKSTPGKQLLLVGGGGGEISGDDEFCWSTKNGIRFLVVLCEVFFVRFL